MAFSASNSATVSARLGFPGGGDADERDAGGAGAARIVHRVADENQFGARMLLGRS